jgi:chemotaxis protein methyltransferase CheR
MGNMDGVLDLRNPILNIKERMDQFYSYPENSDEYYKKIQGYVSRRLDIELSHYRDKYLHRRIYFRIQRLDVTNYRDYFNFLVNNPVELEEFKKAITIHVTTFFRDVEPFKLLEKEIIPNIAKLKRGKQDRTIRILSAPCSTGQEPYSLAIIAHYLKMKKYLKYPVKIYATDLEKDVLNIGRIGIYDELTMKNISPSSIQRNFNYLGNDTYQVKNRIKQYVEFFEHDLLKPLDLPKIDLVVCRNFLIYISKSMQSKVLYNIIPSMSPQGYLMLGKTEGFPLLHTGKFSPINIREHIYQFKKSE